MFRTLIGLSGLVVVTIGLALIPLPGPGWLIVLTGLAIWAIEFVWARQLLSFTTQQLYRWNAWQRGRPWVVRLSLLLVVLAITATAAWLSIKQAFGVDLVQRIFHGSGSGARTAR